MQFSTDTTVHGLCSNPNCTRGKDGGRDTVALRDTRGGAAYCSQACQAIIRYKKRYRGTNAGPVSKGVIDDKMKRL